MINSLEQSNYSHDTFIVLSSSSLSNTNPVTMVTQGQKQYHNLNTPMHVNVTAEESTRSETDTVVEIFESQSSIMSENNNISHQSKLNEHQEDDYAKVLRTGRDKLVMTEFVDNDVYEQDDNSLEPNDCCTGETDSVYESIRVMDSCKYSKEAPNSVPVMHVESQEYRKDVKFSEGESNEHYRVTSNRENSNKSKKNKPEPNKTADVNRDVKSEGIKGTDKRSWRKKLSDYFSKLKSRSKMDTKKKAEKYSRQDENHCSIKASQEESGQYVKFQQFDNSINLYDSHSTENPCKYNAESGLLSNPGKVKSIVSDSTGVDGSDMSNAIDSDTDDGANSKVVYKSIDKMNQSGINKEMVQNNGDDVYESDLEFKLGEIPDTDTDSVESEFRLPTNDKAFYISQSDSSMDECSIKLEIKNQAVSLDLDSDNSSMGSSVIQSYDVNPESPTVSRHSSDINSYISSKRLSSASSNISRHSSNASAVSERFSNKSLSRSTSISRPTSTNSLNRLALQNSLNLSIRNSNGEISAGVSKEQLNYNRKSFTSFGKNSMNLQRSCSDGASKKQKSQLSYEGVTLKTRSLDTTCRMRPSYSSVDLQGFRKRRSSVTHSMTSEESTSSYRSLSLSKIGSRYANSENNLTSDLLLKNKNSRRSSIALSTSSHESSVSCSSSISKEFNTRLDEHVPESR